MNPYTVSIHRFIDTRVKPRVHVSNPALYVTPASDGSTRVIFVFPDDSGQAWSIHFKDRTPFCTGNTPVTDVSTSTPLALCSSVQAGDYNYTVTVAASGGIPAAAEDPQVIIGGRGTNVGLWGIVGISLAGLLLVMTAFRVFFGRARAGNSA